MKTMTGKFGTAFSPPLPPVAERPNHDTVAALPRWLMTIRGQHPLWDRFCILTCSLADFPGVPPAKKQFPEATHELTVCAIDPRFPQKDFEEGRVAILEPVNHVIQIIATDALANAAAEALACEFINQRQLVEPSGITGAREAAYGFVRRFIKEGTHADERKDLEGVSERKTPGGPAASAGDVPSVPAG